MDYIGDIPANLKYSKEHEWAKEDGDSIVVGITDYAQHALTDIVFVELPEAGKEVEQFKNLCIVESVKSVSDVFSPASGKVTEVNTEVTDAPELVNNDPYGKGWFAKIALSKKEELGNLMSSEEYKKYLEGLE